MSQCNECGAFDVHLYACVECNREVCDYCMDVCVCCACSEGRLDEVDFRAGCEPES